jgi:putative ABC transport system permease protein
VARDRAHRPSRRRPNRLDSNQGPKWLGAALGLAGAIAVTRALRGLLYGVTPIDGFTIARVIALVAAVALVAVGWPAWRAARVDPATALRAE